MYLLTLPLAMTKHNSLGLPGPPGSRIPIHGCTKTFLGSNLLAINYLVALLLMSLIDAIMPEAMAKLAVPRASGCALARW